MQYVLLDMRWDVARQGKQFHYYVSEFSAVLIDNELHTVRTFQFVNEKEYSYSKGQLHIQGEDKLCVSSFQNGWEAFGRWMPKDSLFVLWDSSVLNAIEYCSKLGRKSYAKFNIIELKILYEKMTTEIKREKEITLSKALVELDLTCDKDAMKHSTYRAQAMLRLFRKIKHKGTEIVGALFMQHVCFKEYYYIAGKTYFPELQEKMRRKEQNNISDCMKAMGVECKVVKSVVKIQTDFADWAFSVGETGTELHYFTNQYFKGLRKTSVSWNKDTSMKEKLEKILNEMSKIERTIQYGVGNEKISELVRELCR